MPAPPFEELKGSPIIKRSYPVGQSISRKLLCTWNDRIALMNWFIDDQSNTPYAGTLAYPRSASATPFGDPDNTDPASAITYKKAVVAVEYKSPGSNSPQQADGKLFTLAIAPTIEAMQLSAKRFVWGDANHQPDLTATLSPDEAPYMTFRGLDIVYTRFQMTTVPVNVFSFVGLCNSDNVSFFGIMFTKGQLLFMPPAISGAPDEGFRISYRFSYKPQTWNVWLTENDNYRQIFYKKAPNKRFYQAKETAIFGNL